MNIQIIGGPPSGHPEQILQFTADGGRRVTVVGGLPDLLQGEPEGQRRVTRGTGTIADDIYLSEPVAIPAQDEVETPA